MKGKSIIKNSVKVLLSIILFFVLVPGVQADGDIKAIANQPITIGGTNSINGVLMVGYQSDLVKWDGNSWETSPVVGSCVSDSTGQVSITFIEKNPGTYYYKFHLPAASQPWFNTITVTVSASLPVTVISAASTPVSVTAVFTPEIQSTPPSSLPSNSRSSNLSLTFTPTATATTADTMFRANPGHTGVFDNGGIVSTNTELWRFKTADSVFSSPAVSNGVVYVGSEDKNLYAIDAVTGTEKWRLATGYYVSSSPAVSNGIVYVGSVDKNLYAVDTVTGKEKWRFTTGGSIYSSPAVSNGVVYVGSYDKNLYAIDAVTGTEKWRFTTGGSIYSSPAVSNGVVYVGSYDKNLYAIDAVTGKEKWRFTTGGSIYSSPAVSNGVVYIGSYDKNLYAIDAVTGTEKWRFTVKGSVYSSNIVSSPAVSNGIVYVGGGMSYKLFAIDAVTGTEKWQFAIQMTFDHESSPVVSNNVVYVGSYDKNLYAIDAVTGTEKWRFKTGSWVYSSPAVSNGVVYVGSNDGNLYAIGEVPPGLVYTHTPVSTQTLAPNQVTITTVVPAPGIQNTLSSEFFSDNGFSYTSLPIIGLVAIVFLAGGGYTIYRMKKKPSDYQPYERKEKKAISPQSTPTGSTIQPELTLLLDRTQLAADNWDRMEIRLENRGNAPAKDIHLTFSDEFDTKWIKPAAINAGATTSLEIGIRPKLQGKIPLEVTALYRDDHDKEYRETHEFWIDVVEKSTTPSPPSETPSSPVSQFTPRPLTPKRLPPDLSGRYTESEFIGKGGFARVFKAKRKDGKYVAVKIPISLDAMTGRSFITEMQNWTKLSHPNIVRLYDFNIMPLPYFEEELCDSALSDREKPLESQEAAWILFSICEGLKFAHAHKIIHRDLKPQNILLKNGVPKISDWGLSRIISESSTTTATSFTPSYAAPEQINNKVKDERTDIWQLGVILYELITGVLPFTGDSMVEIGMNIATKDPERPVRIIPDTKVIEPVVMKCLQKDPAKRYQSVLELQKDLATFLRVNYTELLKTSVTAHDNNRSAYYCGDLVLINLLTGDIPASYKYLLDLVHYSRGDVKIQAQELSEQIKMRMENGFTEVPDELIQKAEIIVHKVSMGFGNKR